MPLGPATAGELSCVESEVAGEEVSDQLALGLDRRPFQDLGPVRLLHLLWVSVGGEFPQLLIAADDRGDELVLHERPVIGHLIRRPRSKEFQPGDMRDRPAEQPVAEFRRDRQMPQNPNRRMTVPRAWSKQLTLRNVRDDAGKQTELEFVEGDEVVEHGEEQSGTLWW